MCLTGYWQRGRRSPVAPGDERVEAYLASPVQDPTGQVYLDTLMLLHTGRTLEEKTWIPVRRASFGQTGLGKVLETAHRIGDWVVTSDPLVDRRLYRNHGVRVIRYVSHRHEPRNLVVSTNRDPKLLLSFLEALLSRLIPHQDGEERSALAEWLIEQATNLSGQIVMRAAKYAHFANELVGVVLSMALVRRHLAAKNDRHIGWYFLDDYASWFGTKEGRLADLLVLNPAVDEDGQPYLNVLVTESKFVSESGYLEAARKSARQLVETIGRLATALEPSSTRLDRTVWLDRLGDLMAEGMDPFEDAPLGGMALYGWVKAVKDDQVPVQLVGLSHVFVHDGSHSVSKEPLPLKTSGIPCLQQVFDADTLRRLLTRVRKLPPPAAADREMISRSALRSTDRTRAAPASPDRDPVVPKGESAPRLTTDSALDRPANVPVRRQRNEVPGQPAASSPVTWHDEPPSQPKRQEGGEGAPGFKAMKPSSTGRPARTSLHRRRIEVGVESRSSGTVVWNGEPPSQSGKREPSRTATGAGKRSSADPDAVPTEQIRLPSSPSYLERRRPQKPVPDGCEAHAMLGQPRIQGTTWRPAQPNSPVTADSGDAGPSTLSWQSRQRDDTTTSAHEATTGRRPMNRGRETREPEHVPPYPAPIRKWLSSGREKIREEEGETWLQETLVALCKAFRSYAMTSEVVRARLTPNAALVSFRGTDDLTVSRVEKRQQQLLTSHALEVIDVHGRPGEVVVMVRRPKRVVLWLHDQWRKRALPETAPWFNTSFLLGARENDGELFYLNIASEFGGQPQHGPHVLIAGETGSGKGVLVQNLLLDICATNAPGAARIWMIDPKAGVDYPWLQDLPHLEGDICTTQAGAMKSFDAVIEAMEERYRLLASVGALNIFQYNKRVARENRFPMLWLFHDEMADWMVDRDYRATVEKTVTRLASKARAAGISLVLVTQRPDKDAVPPLIRANLGNRLVLRVSDRRNSELVLDDPVASRLLGKGHLAAKLVGEGEIVLGQVPFAGPDETRELAEAIVASWKD